MFRHLPYRFSVIYSAIVVATLGISSMAHAISLGQPVVQSEQHEVLSATIQVSDIDAKNFHVSLANEALYQQMQLVPTSGVQVQFVPHSDNSGVIMLSSTQPISTPFADIVLNLENGSEQKTDAQTLLMPLPKSNKITPSNTAVAQQAQINLPVSNITYPTAYDSNLWATDTTTNVAPATPSETTTYDNAQILSEEERVISSITPEGVNTQINILTEQVIRRILPPEDSTYTASTATSGDIPLVETPLNTQVITQTDTEPTSPIGSEMTTETTIETQNTDAPVYIVQSGDSLWQIANQIAKANKLNVADVMKALHEQNPNAFNNNNINQLKANTSLNIPNYDVVPSQQAIASAISTQRHSTRTTTRPNRTNIQASRTISRPLPKPQVTLVTPSQSGQAIGAQSHSNTVSGSTGNEQLVSTLKNTRNQAAQNAQRVNSLSQELNSATQRLELQNNRLAELEARLKALKENK